jgi:hypothetical protein
VDNLLWITQRLEVDTMPPGSKPQPVGKSDQRETVFKWNLAELEGWQHGKIPAPAASLSAHGKRAWKTWMNAWWASFYSAEDLPGLQLLVMLYDKVMLEEIDVTKILPLLDRYGITPKGRQDLRRAQLPVKAEASTPTPEVQDEIAERRQTRRSNLA